MRKCQARCQLANPIGDIAGALSLLVKDEPGGGWNIARSTSDCYSPSCRRSGTSNVILMGEATSTT
ncbi:hypothetical protein PCAR4_250034 [Paraburkholderia caribensis]|nr:hypothetical protein PCAR4_250034 [Paraburkholderia caribensis]